MLEFLKTSGKSVFYVQETCDWTKQEQIDEIKREMIRTTQRWLEAFRNKARADGRGDNVVKDITVEQVDAGNYTIGGRSLESAMSGTKGSQGSIRPSRGVVPYDPAIHGPRDPQGRIAVGGVHNSYVFVVFFYCTAKDAQPEYGGAFALVSLLDFEMFTDRNTHVPEIHIYLPVCENPYSGSDVSGSPSSDNDPCVETPEFYEYCRKNPRYRMQHVPISKHVLLHEIGHAMGLADTYEGSPIHLEGGDIAAGKKNFNYDDPTHVGKAKEVNTGLMIRNEDGEWVTELAHRHPESVMSCDYKGEDADGNPVLAGDDINGVNSVYTKFKALGYFGD